MESMLLPLKRYAEFSGRSRRSEYWMYFLFTIIVIVGLSMVEAVLGMGGMVGGIYGPLTTLYILATFVPNIAVGIRRLHDIDKSGWFLLLGLIPFVGGIILLVFFVMDGTRGANRFGPDPKDPAGAQSLKDVFG